LDKRLKQKIDNDLFSDMLWQIMNIENTPIGFHIDHPAMEKQTISKEPLKYINAAQCKKFATEYAKQNKPKFTRVSKDFLKSCEYVVRNHMESRIKNHISKGKTLM